MSKQEQDILFFVTWCIEQYKAHKGLNGEETMTLFDEYGVTDYLCDCYEPLHTQGRQWLMEDIDEFIENRMNRHFSHNHDIVYGPVANDRVYGSLLLYEDGWIDKEELKKRLKAYKLVDQMLFHTPRSLDRLTYFNSRLIQL